MMAVLKDTARDKGIQHMGNYMGNTGPVRPRKGDRYFWAGHKQLDYLDNSYECPFEVDGMKFGSVAWYMWYARAKLWSPNSDLAVLIREAATQGQAKQLSRRCTSTCRGTQTVWATVRLKKMAKAVLRKFECSDELRNRLMQTGEDCLLYALRFDAFYGLGFTMKEAVGRTDEWGKNYLGQMLMLVRKRLRERREHE